MASSIKKQPNGKWRAVIDTHLHGERFRKSKVFERRHEAVEWRLEIERGLRNLRNSKIGNDKIAAKDITELLYEHKIFSEQLKSYASKLPASQIREKNRLLHLKKTTENDKKAFFFNKQPSQITIHDIDRFIAYRKSVVKGETIRKEITQLGMVYSSYGRDFELNNPFKKIKKPSPSKSRTQRLKKPMEKILLRFFKENTLRPAYRIAIVLAVETAMRAGELFSLNWDQIDLDRRTIYLSKTKNGSERTVPLTRRAVRYLKLLYAIYNQEGSSEDPKRTVFGVTREGYFTTWHRTLNRLKEQDSDFSDLRFHDLRHEATSRFFEKGLSTVEVQLITGHKTLSMLNRYTHLDALNLIAKIG